MKRSKTDTRMFIDIYTPKGEDNKKWKKTDKYKENWWMQMEEEQDILSEIKQKKNKKSFESIINNGNLSDDDLDEVMMEA